MKTEDITCYIHRVFTQFPTRKNFTQQHKCEIPTQCAEVLHIHDTSTVSQVNCECKISILESNFKLKKTFLPANGNLLHSFTNFGSE